MLPTGYIRNAWYVAARSEDISRSLTPVKIMGHRMVMFRRSDGGVSTLKDACPHRKLPLSKGTLQGDVVVCGYHGLTFDGAGTCVAAPTQPEAVPRRARVTSWPTIERYGFVWVWPGVPEAADPESLIDIPHYDDPSWGRTACGALDIACHYLWITDNLLDPSHVAWVHLTSFAGAGTEDVPLQITEAGDRLIVSRWIDDRPPPPYYKPILGFAGNADRKQHYEMRLPSIAINKSVYAPVGTGGVDDGDLPGEAFVGYSYNFMTPVDDDHSLYFWFQHRNQHPDDAALSQRMFEGATMAFNEDREVLEAVHDGMKSSEMPFLSLGLDAGAIRFRRMVQRRAEAEQADAVA